MESKPRIFPDTFNQLDDERWLEVLLKSLKQRMISGVEMPEFPEENTQKLFTSFSGNDAIIEAFNFFQIVKEQSIKYNIPFNINSKFLDFGSGWGRISRCFLKDLNSENIFGIDVFPDIVEKCKKIIPYCNFSVCDFSPPTNFENNSFDIIVGFSVFSHLSEQLHLKWIEEFARILKTDGILVVTTLASSFVEICKNAIANSLQSDWHRSIADGIKKGYTNFDKAQEEFDKGNYFHLPTGGGFFLPEENYGWTVVSEKYARRHWTKNLIFKNYVDESSEIPQAVIVMQKK